MTAWQAYSQLLALISGSLAGVILTAILSEEQLYAWGWRMPFLLGILIAPVGLYIRRQLPETIEPSETHASARAVLAELVRHHARPVLFGVLIICGGTVATYVFTYMTTYAITTLQAVGGGRHDAGAHRLSSRSAGRCDAGRVGDRFGRKRDAGGDARRCLRC